MNNKKRSVIFLFGILFFIQISNSYAQNLKRIFDKVTVENGLSQSSVFSIAQDSLGYIWFGTKDGLNRYDAKKIEIFKHNPKDPKSLSSSQNINALLTDATGRLWIGTQKGLNLFSAQSKTFTHYLTTSRKENRLSNHVIRCLFQDTHKQIWVGTENGLNRLNAKGIVEASYAIVDGLSDAVIRSLYQDRSGLLWIGTARGINFLDREGQISTTKTKHGVLHQLRDEGISSIFCDQMNRLWIGTQQRGLFIYDLTTEKLISHRIPLPNPMIRKIVSGADGQIWISSLKGLSVINPRTFSTRNYEHDPEDPNSLNQNSLYDLMMDKNGSMWIGSYYGGVNVYHHQRTPFEIFSANRDAQGLSSNVVSAITEDEHYNLWIATEAEGLNFYNRQTNSYTVYKNQPGNSNSISSNLVKALSLDRQGGLWIGTYEGGLDYYNPRTQSFKHYPIKNDKFHAPDYKIVAIIDLKDRLLIGTRGHGIYELQHGAKEIKPYTLDNSRIVLQNIRFFYKQKNDALLIASDSGVSIIQDNKLKSLNFGRLKHLFLDINCIFEDRKGTLWFGSYTNGLLQLDAQTGIVSQYTQEEGLPSNTVVGILEDKQANLWISTADGLSKFNKKTFINYGKVDGLPGNVFNYNSAFMDHAGKMFFGGYNGLVGFQPELVVQNLHMPKIYFSDLYLANRKVVVSDTSKVLKEDLNYIQELSLTYKQNTFSIGFSLLNYIKSNKNKYAFFLEGFNKDWNYTDQGIASFTNVPSGTYTLHIKGANNDGIFSQELRSIRIHILAPFWATGWAYLVYFLCMASIVFLICRFIWIRAKLKQDQEVFQMKLDFFSNVSHEIRTPLSLIVGPIEQLVQETKSLPWLNQRLQILDKNATRLSKLVQELLDFRKVESGHMNLHVQHVNLYAFVSDIFKSFELLAAEKSIDYKLYIKNFDIQVAIDTIQFEKVIYNLLSNAFKFTPSAGKIHLYIESNKDRQVDILVADSGIGISERNRKRLFKEFYQVKDPNFEHIGTGLGLALSEKIAQLHHGKLFLKEESKDDVYHTVFCLRLPVSTTEISVVQTTPIGVSPASDLQILIVEDNHELREFVSNSLAKYYRTLQASNGQEGMAMAKKEMPDLIISDVMMPVLDGIEMSSVLKLDIRTSHIPIILLTARTGEIHELSGLQSGAELYITKPFRMSKMLLQIENLLKLQENIRKKYLQQIALESIPIQGSPHQTGEMDYAAKDQDFLNQLVAYITDNLLNEEFNVNSFASEFGMSTPVLYKKIKALTGLTVNNFIKNIRLKKAAQLLLSKKYSINEIAFMVGFNDIKYFRTEFQKQYDVLPSNYKKDQSKVL